MRPPSQFVAVRSPLRHERSFSDSTCASALAASSVTVGSTASTTVGGISTSTSSNRTVSASTTSSTSTASSCDQKAVRDNNDGPELIYCTVGTYILLPHTWGARVHFMSFKWTNNLGHPRSVTRQQVITAFQVVKEQHVRVQAAYDAFGWWFLRNTDDARAVRAVRAELRERLRGLYWTVATMQRQLDFLARCERRGQLPREWEWTPPDLTQELFPITAAPGEIPSRLGKLKGFGGAVSASLVRTAAGGKAARSFRMKSSSTSITDFTFRVAEYVNRHGEPPIDERTAELALMALELARELRGTV